MPATINGTTGFGGNLTGNVTGNVTGTSSAVADGAVSAAKLDGAQSGSAPIYWCRAWVNFDGTRNEADTGASTNGANVKIRAGGNVSSVRKDAVGYYTVTFTTAMTDSDYAILATVENPDSATVTWGVGPISQSSGSFQILVQNAGGVNNDRSIVAISIFR